MRRRYLNLFLAGLFLTAFQAEWVLGQGPGWWRARGESPPRREVISRLRQPPAPPELAKPPTPDSEPTTGTLLEVTDEEPQNLSTSHVGSGEWIEGTDTWDGAVPGFACLTNSYTEFELLFWWRGGMDIPPLATTSAVGTAQSEAGVLGFPATTTLLGNGQISDDNRVGGRVTYGKWLDPCQVNGVVVRFYTLGDEHVSYDFSPDVFSILGRPFFNVSTAAQDARLTSFPGVSSGPVNVDVLSEMMGGDVYMRMMMSQGPDWRIDLIGGYQVAQFDERLSVSDSLTSLDPSGSVPLGTVIATTDRFETRNEFHAGVVGAMFEADSGCMTFSFLGKVGLGNMSEQVAISGQTSTSVPGGGTSQVSSGLLTQPSNIGEFVRDEFAMVPEFTMKARWRLSDRIALTAGYTFLYCSEIIRPGDQIDSAVNLTQVPGPIVGESRPAFGFNSTDLLIHGLTAGIHGSF